VLCEIMGKVQRFPGTRHCPNCNVKFSVEFAAYGEHSVEYCVECGEEMKCD